MSNVIAAKLNKGFLMRPYGLFHGARRPTRSETIVSGWVYSMTRTEAQECRFGYSSFAEKFGMSRSTVARTVQALRENGYVSAVRKGGQKTVYTYTGTVSQKGHVRTELWLYTEKFCIFGVERGLTNVEIDVLSLISTHTRNDKKKHYEGSIRDIAAILNVSKKSVMRAIDALFSAELIYRQEKALNGHQKSIYTANMRFSRKMDKQSKREEKAKQAQLPASVQAANEKAERDAFYARRRERAVRLAETFELQANKNPRFGIIERALSKVGLELAKAEAVGQNLAELQAKQSELRLERIKILEEQGVEAWQLEPDNHARCKECFDTGWKKDGRACSCYRCRE